MQAHRVQGNREVVGVKIEVTDLMVYAFAGEPEITATDAHAIKAGLTAMLAMVERDYEVTPKLCGETRTDDLAFAYEKCELEVKDHPEDYHAYWPKGWRECWVK
jgi:hypothetical protein